jgi:serine/threonine protein kinase
MVKAGPIRCGEKPSEVQLYEVMATKLRIYFVMEYVRGGELFVRGARGRLREADARRYFQQLLSTVAFCNERWQNGDLFPRQVETETRQTQALDAMTATQVQEADVLQECAGPAEIIKSRRRDLNYGVHGPL